MRATYQLFCNSGHYSAAVALNRNLAARVVWHDTCDFASVVTWDAALTFLSSLLTCLIQDSVSTATYLQALEATSDLIKSAPRDFKYVHVLGL